MVTGLITNVCHAFTDPFTQSDINIGFRFWNLLLLNKRAFIKSFQFSRLYDKLLSEAQHKFLPTSYYSLNKA